MRDGLERHDQAASLPDNLTSLELQVIDLLTQSNLFSWSLPDHSRPFLVLDHPS
jgi:hypothetical protein